MIPGDIDLTENLDFRQTKRKEIKQLPDSWRGNNGISINKYNYITDINSTSSTNISNNNITFYIDDEDTIIYNRNDNLSMPQLSGTFSMSARLYDNDYIITNINYTSSKKYYITTITKPELDVFGNKIIQEPEIQSIPWRNYKESKIKDIAWNNMTLKGRIDDNFLFIEDDIPWETSDDYDWYNIDQSNKFSISKAAKFISYLKGKSSSFIERYLNRETEDNSSYLTNMNWIHVRDAIIE